MEGQLPERGYYSRCSRRFLLLFDLPTQRGWQINPSTQTVHFGKKASAAAAGTYVPAGGAGGKLSASGGPLADEGDPIPKRAMIASNLSFARELESIV